MEFEVGGDDRGCEFSVGSCAGAGTPDLRGDVVKFFAILKRMNMLVVRSGARCGERYLVGDDGAVRSR